MDRSRFLLIAAAASAAGLTPRLASAATSGVRNVRVIRWPKELLHGVPGRCAGMRGRGAFDLERMIAGR